DSKPVDDENFIRELIAREVEHKPVGRQSTRKLSRAERRQLVWPILKRCKQHKPGMGYRQIAGKVFRTTGCRITAPALRNLWLSTPVKFCPGPSPRDNESAR